MAAVAIDLDAEFSRVLGDRAVTIAFQPIFDLASLQIVGLEALARGPAGTAMESPAALFAAAGRSSRTAELDWVCRAAAFRAVLDGGVPPSMSVFVNTEPESLSAECPADLLGVVGRAESLLRVFVEVNDRALAADPAGLLAAADRAREMGWGIAIDDVGSSRAPMAMLPVLHADVVKLDLHLLREADQADAAAVVLATLRHVEQTGASLCVERIENDDDLRWAVSLGAVYGQGRHLAPPGPLAASYPPPRVVVPLVAVSAGDAPVASPLDLLPGVATRAVGLDHFTDVARTVAFGSLAPGASPVVLVGVGPDGFDPGIAAGFPQESGPLLTVVFGVGVTCDPVEGFRGVRLLPADPLAYQRFLVVISEKGAHALLGRILADGRVDIVVTQDPEVAHGVARHLIRRMPPPGECCLALLPPSASSSGAVPPDERAAWRTPFGRRR